MVFAKEGFDSTARSPFLAPFSADRRGESGLGPTSQLFPTLKTTNDVPSLGNQIWPPQSIASPADSVSRLLPLTLIRT